MLQFKQNQKITSLYGKDFFFRQYIAVSVALAFTPITAIFIVKLTLSHTKGHVIIIKPGIIALQLIALTTFSTSCINIHTYKYYR